MEDEELRAHYAGLAMQALMQHQPEFTNLGWADNERVINSNAFYAFTIAKAMVIERNRTEWRYKETGVRPEDAAPQLLRALEKIVKSAAEPSTFYNLNEFIKMEGDMRRIAKAAIAKVKGEK